LKTPEFHSGFDLAVCFVRQVEIDDKIKEGLPDFDNPIINSMLGTNDYTNISGLI
jgi:hypothetical protein